MLLFSYVGVRKSTYITIHPSLAVNATTARHGTTIILYEVIAVHFELITKNFFSDMGTSWAC